VVADVEVEGLGDFFVGERVPVHVATGERETIVVPLDYVYRRHGLAYVRLDDGSEVVVQPGAETDAGIEILSGLRPGDVLGEP
jgi:multidrug efflux pump subunit AcrA (membrane-fusion protein)